MHLSSSSPRRSAPCSLAVLPEKSMFTVFVIIYHGETLIASVWMKHSFSGEQAPVLVLSATYTAPP